MQKIRLIFLGTLFRRVSLAGVILIFMAAFGTYAFAIEKSEQYKIVYLLNAIDSSGLIFIRNDNEYTGHEARDHLQEKLDFAGDRIETAEEFIDFIASKSSITGSSYYVKFPDGMQVEARKWLRDKLEEVK